MVRPDDQSIADSAGFLRALTQDDWWKEMEDRTRVSSVAFFVFDGEPGETSCYQDTIAGRAVFGLRFPNSNAARFTAAEARLCGFNITQDPEGDDGHSPEHFVLTHAKETRRGPYQKECKRLALLARFTTREELAADLPSDSSMIRL